MRNTSKINYLNERAYIRKLISKLLTFLVLLHINYIILKISIIRKIKEKRIIKLNSVINYLL